MKIEMRPRVLFYSHHVRGIGHYVRTRQLIEALEGYDLFYLNGGRELSNYSNPDYVTIRTLPNFDEGGISTDSPIYSNLLYKAQLIGNIENATVIHNALDPSLFANVSLVRLAVNQKRSDRKFIERFLALKTKEKIIIGTAGRLGHVKGTTYLFEAFAKLVKRYSHLHLLLVGEFADLNEKKEWSKWLKKKKLWNHITFTGWIPHPFICAWLHEMDIFVFPSLHEGSPNALLEAMFCGLPIVATDVCGNRDVIDDGKDGFLVASHDADELADKIGILVEDESERSFFGKNTQEKIKKDYTVEKERESWLEIYNQLTRG